MKSLGKKFVLTVIFLLVLVCSACFLVPNASITSFAASDSESTLNGWVVKDGKRYYYENGQMAKGWKTIGKRTYYLQKDGSAATGFKKISRKWYYFSTGRGIMRTGWKTVDGKKYYLGDDGVVCTGWQTIDGSRYYFSTGKGVMRTGWKTIDGKRYYLGKDGKARTGWQTIDGSRYYFSTKKGIMRTGWKTIDGKRYYLGKDGKARTGWQTIKGSRYYFSKSKGIMRTGLKTIDGATYYFGSKGKMVTGWQTIDGKKYYFDTDGKMLKNQIAGTSSAGCYYVDADGVRVTDAQIKQAVTFVNANSSSSQSSYDRLRSCYDAMCKYSYIRIYGDSPSASLIPSYADYLFTNKGGNCYRFASAMAYIARVLGYDSRVAVGSVSTSSTGTTMSAHGWCEIKIDGAWKMLDVTMQQPRVGSVDLFLKTRSTYPYRLSCDAEYTMKLKNQKVSWS